MTEKPAEKTTAIQKVVTEHGIQLRTVADLKDFAKAWVQSGLAGKQTEAQTFLAIQSGLELGLTVMQALQGMFIVNGKFGIMGDTALGLVRSKHYLCDYIHWEYSGEEYEDDYKCTVHTRRHGEKEDQHYSFSVADAKKAKLWNKRGKQGQDTPWITYPKRMLYYRALGFLLRSVYPEAMKGLHFVEELIDIPAPDAAYECQTPKREDRKPAADVTVSDAVTETEQTPPDDPLLRALVDGLIQKFLERLKQSNIELAESEIVEKFQMYCSGMRGGLPEDYATADAFTPDVCEVLSKSLDNKDMVSAFIERITGEPAEDEPGELDLDKLEDLPLLFICAECKAKLARDDKHGRCPECGANSVEPYEQEQEVSDGRDNTTG